MRTFPLERTTGNATDKLSADLIRNLASAGAVVISQNVSAAAAAAAADKLVAAEAILLKIAKAINQTTDGRQSQSQVLLPISFAPTKWAPLCAAISADKGQQVATSSGRRSAACRSASERPQEAPVVVVYKRSIGRSIRSKTDTDTDLEIDKAARVEWPSKFNCCTLNAAPYALH